MHHFFFSSFYEYEIEVYMYRFMDDPHIIRICID